MNLLIIKKGRANADKALREISSLPTDKAWQIEIREIRPRRTEQQNRYLFGVCYKTILEQGGEALGGWTKDDLHEHFLGEHFGTEQLVIGMNSYERPMRRSSRLNKQEFSDYVAFVQHKAADLGIVIPDPDEYLADDPKDDEEVAA